jgi:trk system potassium uptake protein TrkA
VHIVILGCGRVGSLLADRLDEAGHSVAIVDQDSRAFRRLRAQFSGETVTGVGFDRETLERAGIERAHAFAAVSSGDNTNILAARVARETYGVENVVARIYDPRRAQVYQRLGIPTVATVSWTAEQITRGLLPQGAYEEYRDPSDHIVLSEVAIHASWFGHPVADLESMSSARVAFITRLGNGVLPEDGMVLQDGDLVHMLTRASDMSAIEQRLAAPRPSQEES